MGPISLLQVLTLGILPQLASPARRTVPVLEFPNPVVDDTASYQGYRTRFYRDSKGNALQIYVDAQSGRVVNLWADAVNESVGFTIRNAGGRPAPIEFASETAVVGDSAGTRWLEYMISIREPRVEIGWLQLGSMRVERDLQYAKWHLRPYSDSAFHIWELDSLIAAVGRLAPAERARHLELLGVRDVSDLQSRLDPSVARLRTDDGDVVRVSQPSFDGRNRLRLELRLDSNRGAIELQRRRIVVRSLGSGNVRLRVRVATDSKALTPLTRNEIFNSEFLRWVDAQRVDDDSLRRQPALASSAPDAAAQRYAWLERQVKGAELLSSREKLMAGLPNFATYFGRDGMMTALMMRSVWQPATTEHVIASVLRKLSPDGLVSHEEALGGQAIREGAAEYSALLRSYVRAKEGDTRRADSLLARSRDVLANLQRVRENYSMLDDKFQLPVLVARWITDTALTQRDKRAFLLDSADNGEPRLRRLVRALEVVARLSEPYAQSQSATDLVAFKADEGGRWHSSSWRDSGAGYANGRYAMDINVIWVPEALRSVAQILEELRSMQLVAGDSIQSAVLGPYLGNYVRSPDALRGAIDVWSSTSKHFVVRMSPEQVRGAVDAKLAWLPEDDRRFWRSSNAAATTDSLEFLAIALDESGRPIPVVSTDPATHLFLGDLTAQILTGATSQQHVLRELDAIMRPYPVGLFVEGLGPLATNDVYASNAVWDRFREDGYHGPRVVWGREVNLVLAGLAKQIGAAYDANGTLRDPSLLPYAQALADALRRTNRAVQASGLEHLELWSYRITPGGSALQPARFGFSSDVQLWNTTNLAVQFALSRLERQLAELSGTPR